MTWHCGTRNVRCGTCPTSSWMESKDSSSRWLETSKDMAIMSFFVESVSLKNMCLCSWTVFHVLATATSFSFSASVRAFLVQLSNSLSPFQPVTR